MSFIKPQFEGIPHELRSIPRWVVWRAEGQADEKPRKVPYCADRPSIRASSTNPSTWGRYEQAEAAFSTGNFTGVGFVLNGDGLVGVDIDHCINDGQTDPKALELLNQLGTGYVEVSPSGTGLRAFGYADGLATGSKGKFDGLDIELYSTGRYLTVTGSQIKSGPVLPLRGFRELADRMRAGRSAKQTGAFETVAPDKRHADLLRRIRSGDVYHDSLRDLAASLVATGMHDGAVVNHLRALMDNSDGPHDERWLARRGQISDLVDSAAKKFTPSPAQAALLESPTMPHVLLKSVSVLDVLTRPSEPPAFVWDGLLPRGLVSMLGAHGGVGKSTVALMLAVCAALGRSLFDINVQHCKTVFVSLEDGTDLVRHRLSSICKQWRIDPYLLDGWLQVVDGTEYPELFAAERRSDGTTTATYDQLRALVKEAVPGLVIIDNASDAFGGDEIQRKQVRAFIRSLAELARLTDCAVLLLAHVDKTTSRNKKADGGEGYSGSTAWHNSARSRLFMSRGDDGFLTLEHQKSNLGKMREPMRLQWLNNGLPELLDWDAAMGDLTQKSVVETQAATALLGLLAEFESRGQYCSPAITSRNNVHAVLKSEPAFLKLKLSALDTRRIINQCQRENWIDTVDYKSPDRKARQRWSLTAQGRQILEDVPTAPAAPTPPVNQSQHMAHVGAPAAPTSVGGMGESAHNTRRFMLAHLLSWTAPTAPTVDAEINTALEQHRPA